MKYELIKTNISAERTVMQDIVEIIDEVETVTGQEETNEYDELLSLWYAKQRDWKWVRPI